MIKHLDFLDRFSKNRRISNFMKIRPLGAEFHADRQTDIMKLIFTFLSFANAPKVLVNHNQVVQKSKPSELLISILSDKSVP